VTPDEVDALVAARLEGVVAQVNAAFKELYASLSTMAAAVVADHDQQQAFNASTLKALGMAAVAKSKAATPAVPALGEITVRLEHGLPPASLKKVHRTPRGDIDYIEEVREA
jgi:hypothetical protein